MVKKHPEAPRAPGPEDGASSTAPDGVPLIAPKSGEGGEELLKQRPHPDAIDGGTGNGPHQPYP